MFATKENVINSENAILNHFLLSLVQTHTPTNKIKLKDTLPIPTNSLLLHLTSLSSKYLIS